MRWRLFGKGFHLALGLLTLTCFILATGCGGMSKSDVSGTVSYKGKKLGNGVIQFVGKDARESSLIGADGSYRIAKAPHGSVKVVVETTPPNALPTPKMGTPKDAGGGPPMKIEGEAGAQSKGEYVPIPAKYKSEDTTPLTYEVTSGKQTKDFDLTD